MANALTTEKNKLCLFIDDHPKAKARDLIEHCRKEAKTLARFMQEDPSVFSAEKQFTFQKQINSELQKMLVARLSSQKQQRITSFFKP